MGFGNLEYRKNDNTTCQLVPNTHYNRHILITRDPKFTVKTNDSVTQRVPSLSNAAKFIKTTKIFTQILR